MHRNRLASGLLAGLLFAYGSSAWAGFVTVQSSWQFYQFGAAQSDPGNFTIGQSHFTAPAGQASTREYRIAPDVYAFSSARVDITGHSVTPDVFSYSALYTGTSFATVGAGYPEGFAQAGAGLDFLSLEFELSDWALVSLGSNAAAHLYEVEVARGTQLLAPGTYWFSYSCLFCFETEVLVSSGPGVALDSASLFFNLSFARVPAPGAWAVLLAALLLLGCLRATRS